MNVTVRPGRLAGSVSIPGSKSHTIRALLMAAMAEGRSTISAALDSDDTASCMRVLQQMGVEISRNRTDSGLELLVSSRGPGLERPETSLDCGNSGTTLYLALSLAALQGFPVRFTGDRQLQSRTAAPLLGALETLGAMVHRENGECVPFTLTGPVRGGAITMESPVSQFLSSLLLAAGFTRDGMRIRVPLLNEKPYVGITLSWLDRLGIRYERDGWESFSVPGNQTVAPFAARMPGDFSSATFFFAAAAMTGSELSVEGLDLTDSQGDKAVVDELESLGASVGKPSSPGESIAIRGPEAGALCGGRIDLNAMPDALPALAILGTVANEPLALVNVPQARQKETDRIEAMTAVINSLGGRAREMKDGMVVEPGRLRGGTADSQGDHRIAMALAIAGLAAEEPVTVTNAEVASITFPGFYSKLAGCGAAVEIDEDEDAGSRGL